MNCQVLRADVPDRILFVHSGGQWIRGSERVLVDSIQHLDRSRFAPLAWTNCAPLGRLLAERGVHSEIDRFSVLFDRRRPAFDIANYLSLVRKAISILRGKQVSLIHCNSSEACQWMVPAARRVGIPLLVELHLDAKLLSRCVRLVHHAGHITGVSHHVIAPYLTDGVPSARLSVTHPDLDPARLDSMPTVSRESFGLVASDCVVLGVGSLLHHKGFDILVRAVARVRASDRRVMLVLAGDGEERQRLEQLSASSGLTDRTVFLGSVSNAPALMRDLADVVVVPSRRESFGLVLLEAGYFGRPCIAAAVGGTSDIIRHGQSGLLVPSDDATALAGALQTLIDGPSLAGELGRDLRARVHAEFLAPAHTRQLETLYDQLLTERSRGAHFTSRVWYPAYGALLRRAAGAAFRRFQ